MNEYGPSRFVARCVVEGAAGRYGIAHAAPLVRGGMRTYDSNNPVCGARNTDTNHKPKILLEHQGEPLIEHIVRPIDMSEQFAKLVFVLSPKHGNQIIDYVGRNPLETSHAFVWQNEPLGFGHAVLQAKEEVFSWRKWNPPVLVATDDGIRGPASPNKSSLDLIHEMTDSGASAVGVKWVGNVRPHGLVVTEEHRALGYAPRPHIPRRLQVTRVIEKPYWDEGGLVMTGIYFIRESRRLFRCLRQLVKTGRQLGGEYQFTHALQMMIENGAEFRTLCHEWEDAGRREDQKTRERENEK